jgi:hypothetical protein
MKRPNSPTYILLASLLLTGCSSLKKTIDPGITRDQCNFTDGATHYHQVLDELGPPARLTACSPGFAFIYEALVVKELQVGLNGRNGLLQLLKISMAGTTLHRKSLLLKFNSDGMLVNSGFLESKEDLGKSGALQPFLAIRQIVDTSEFEDDAMDAADWGASLLDPLPQVLNSRQNLNTGAAGLEQCGTTTDIGQHSLEMR